MSQVYDARIKSFGPNAPQTIPLLHTGELKEGIRRAEELRRFRAAGGLAGKQAASPVPSIREPSPPQARTAVTAIQESEKEGNLVEVPAEEKVIVVRWQGKGNAAEVAGDGVGEKVPATMSGKGKRKASSATADDDNDKVELESVTKKARKARSRMSRADIEERATKGPEAAEVTCYPTLLPVLGLR